MALYDLYERSRGYRLSPQEIESLNQARQAAARLEADPSMERRPGGFWSGAAGFTVHPETAAYMKIAMDRASAQFYGHGAIPEDIETGIRFPGIDPVGQYSAIDMKFAQREAATEWWNCGHSTPSAIRGI